MLIRVRPFDTLDVKHSHSETALHCLLVFVCQGKFLLNGAKCLRGGAHFFIPGQECTYKSRLYAAAHAAVIYIASTIDPAFCGDMLQDLHFQSELLQVVDSRSLMMNAVISCWAAPNKSDTFYLEWMLLRASHIEQLLK